MYGNRSFNQASKAETPQFASAAALQGQAEANSKAQENSQLSNNLMGAGALYNQGMGENTPLADLITEAFGPEETINALRSTAIPMSEGQIADSSAMADFGAPATEAMAQQMAMETAQREAAMLAARESAKNMVL